LELKTLLEPYKTISIIGLGKNVGKTTVLNHLIERWQLDNVRLALTSIGRDGEEYDVVTQKPKPRIFVPAGTIVITTTALIGVSDIRTELLMETGWTSPLGKIVIVEALTPGLVQVGGPSMTKQLEGLIQMLKNFQIDKILIDGALGRKSLAKPTIAEASILCTGAALSPNMDCVVSQTRYATHILTLPRPTENANPIHLTGAISDEKIRTLITSSTPLTGKTIVACDPSKIFITPDTLKKLHIKKAALAVKTPINLVAITANPTSPNSPPFDPHAFKQALGAALPLPVFDVIQVK